MFGHLIPQGLGISIDKAHCSHEKQEPQPPGNHADPQVAEPMLKASEMIPAIIGAKAAEQLRSVYHIDHQNHEKSVGR